MFDAKLEEVESSSSSSEDEDAMVDESQKTEKMERQKPESTVVESCDQFEFVTIFFIQNIMTYPYPEKQPAKQEKGEKTEEKVDRVVEIQPKDH